MLVCRPEGTDCIVAPKWQAPPCRGRHVRMASEFPNGKEKLALRGQMPTERLLREALRAE